MEPFLTTALRHHVLPCLVVLNLSTCGLMAISTRSQPNFLLLNTSHYWWNGQRHRLIMKPFSLLVLVRDLGNPLIAVHFLIFCFTLHRHTISKDICEPVQENLDSPFSRFCPRLYSSFRSPSCHRRWSSRQYLLQAFLLFRPSVWSCWWTRVGAVARNDCSYL